MKIEYITADLFKTDIYTIVHGCNAQRRMGKGVAGIVREEFPEAYQAYLTGDMTLGNVIWVETKNKLIGNAITQQFYGYDGKLYVSYDAVRLAFKEINNKVATLSDKRVAMPAIGAGLGGGKWSIISKIIEEETIDCIPIVYLLNDVIPE